MIKRLLSICAFVLISPSIQAQDSGPDSTISIQSPVSVQKEQLYTLAPTESLHVKGQIDAEKNYRKRSGQIGE
jgi:hypothetical protein